eukprot:10812850-Alexandrium_andersonii.AAC.1
MSDDGTLPPSDDSPPSEGIASEPSPSLSTSMGAGPLDPEALLAGLLKSWPSFAPWTIFTFMLFKASLEILWDKAWS